MLKTLLLRRNIDAKKKMIEDLRARDEEFSRREKELEASINEVTTDEERSAVESEIETYETEKAAHEEEKANLEKEVNELEDELREAEEADRAAGEHATESTAPTEEQREVNIMNEAVTRDAATMGYNIRDRFDRMSIQQRDAIFTREDVKGWIGEIRAHISEKRELTNIGLTIPEVFIGYLRENVTRYSKLYRHTNVQRINGKGREVIMGSVPEAIWTECCAALNELSLSFNDVEIDCFKLGGYFTVCNAVLQDSDIALSALLLDAISQAIGLALDKAILYGKNTASNQKMPLGVVSRLVQTSEPAGYPATARPWIDLHEINVISIPSTATGLELFQQLTTASGKAKGKYARGQKVWVMNEETYTALKVNAMSINAAGAIVSGIENTMPIVGGAIEILDFIPNNVIIGGYFELYLLAERAGQQFAQSEHAFFLQDKTAFKGTARYDGTPVIAEAFVAIGINGVTPDAAMDFAPDDANTVQNVLLNQSVATIIVDDTLSLKAVTTPVDGAVVWESSDDSVATVSGGVVTGVAAGTAVITATSGSANATCTVTVSTGA